MRRVFIIVLATACAITLLPHAFGDTFIVGDAQSYRLGGRLEILRDGTGAMTITDVRRDSASWKRASADEPNPGFTRAVYWVRFQLSSPASRRLLLVFSWANIDLVHVFVIRADGTMETMTSGDHIPFARRPLPYRIPLFPIAVQANSPLWCYVQVLDTQAIFPLSLWDETAFFRTVDHNAQAILGLLLGLILIVVLFNALFFFATRDRAYLFYLFFVLVYLLFELTFRGVSGEYLWPAHSWIDNSVYAGAASLAITTGLLFARGFLQTKVWAPSMHRFLGLVMCLGAAITISTIITSVAFVDPASLGSPAVSFWRIIVEATNIYLLFSVIVLITNAVMVLRRGFRAARFYLAAWVVFFAGGIGFSLLNAGLVPSNPLTRNALSAGAALEMVLLFLAIVDRYLHLRRENEKNQKERLEAVEKRLYSDPLTDLPNRNRLNADLPQGAFATIILVNIDRFRDVNECFGQKAGDHVIRELGSRIRSAVSDHGSAVYRLHADEYAVLIPRAFGNGALSRIGRLLVARCQDEPYRWEDTTLHVTVSVGAAVTDSRHLEKADMALSVARSKKALVNYRPELDVVRRYADNLRWLYVIRESIESRLQALKTDASQAGLTGREHEIALLLSERLSMAEIAERLFISRRTVEKHAENIYLKLGIRKKQEVGERLLNFPNT